MTDTYQFQREDTGAVMDVDFATMMQQDAAGYLTLPDGCIAKRIRMPLPAKSHEPHDIELAKPILSDALGFTEAQLSEFEVDRKANGFTGIEFVRDPMCAQFYQVKITSMAEWARYVKHRGMRDKNSRNGGAAVPSDADFERLRQEMLEKYPVATG